MGWRPAKNKDKVYIGQLCPGFIDVNVTNTTSKSGHAQAIITFEDLELALATFERLLVEQIRPW